MHQTCSLIPTKLRNVSCISVVNGHRQQSAMTILRHGRVSQSRHLSQYYALPKNVVLARKSDANRKSVPVPIPVETVGRDSSLKTSKQHQPYSHPVSYEVFDDLPFRLREGPYTGQYYNPHFPDFPWRILTLLRFIQVVETNISMYTLTRIGRVVLFLKLAKLWTVVIAVILHLVIWLLEENMVRSMSTRNTALFQCGITSISFIYTICSSYIVVFLFVYYDYSNYVAVGVPLASVLYFSYHLHWVTKATRTTAVLQHAHDAKILVHFNDTTRPETIDTRLNIGPQLIYPKPEEYSVPGQSGEVNA